MLHLPQPSARTLKIGLALLLVVAALALTFGLYTRPDFLVQLSNQLWACF
jgi:hypothetical protein